MVQRKGTEFIGSIFGPVMLVWFAAIARARHRAGSSRAPGILAALNPLSAVTYLLHAGPGIGFAVLGAAFLAVTGGEAMYADMGHFGRRPIRLGWFAIVLPALMLNYFGQGALLLADPSAVENPFYLLAPGWAHYPLVAFATVATIIASQAIISGAYSLTQQAMQLGFLPRMRVLHTASHEKGQIYMPIVNWPLAVGTIGAVISFGSSDALGGAYGIAVSMLMAITTVLAALIALKWGYNPLAVAAVNGFFLVIDLIFVAANATKLIEGGWFPLLLAAIVAFLMLTWRTGWQTARAPALQHAAGARTNSWTGCSSTRPFACRVRPRSSPPRAPASRSALTHHLRHNRVLHERVLLVSTVNTDAPRVDPDQRVKLVPVGAGITRVLLYFGFMESPNVMEGLKLACTDPELRGIDPGADHLLLPPGHGHPERQGARDGGVEKAALRGDAPQRQSPRRLFRRAAVARRGSRARGRNLGRTLPGFQCNQWQTVADKIRCCNCRFCRKPALSTALYKSFHLPLMRTYVSSSRQLTPTGRLRR